MSHSLCDLFELFGRLAAFRHHQAHSASELQIIHLHVAIYAYFHRYLLSVLRIRDVYPGSFFLPIPNPGSKNSNNREGWKKICCHTFFVATNFTKLKIIFFWNAEEKSLGQFSKNYRSQEIVTKLSKLWVWDPRSGIQGLKRYRIPDPDPQHWFRLK